VLVFADAALQWHPDGIAALVEMMQRSRADLLTIWATQITRSRSERLVVPLMALAILGYLPVLLVHQPALPEFAAASGQCLAFRREAYQAVGGYIAVRDRVDIAFARRIKAKGMRLRLADGAGLITCRMYRNWREVRDGFARHLLVGYGGRVSFLVLATLFHLLVFVLPWVWLLFGTPEGYPLVPLVLIALGVGVRGLTAWVTRQRIHDALWMPISVLLMTRIAVYAIWWQRQNGRKVQT
jgi:chlorobactene glucosyltransferase